ncbi:hypothetical protein SH2C18_07190 [Clostridium sediminicola]|uniref:CehA/McbA family metallohydrolase n=1 Tax=Clostridium sediminicola TaxID=3114879 RepID=UPI0031F21B14
MLNIKLLIKFKNKLNKILCNKLYKKIYCKNVITISEAKNESGRTNVRIRGIVISSGNSVYIQDKTSGINLHKAKNKISLVEGDFVEIYGTLSRRKGSYKIKRYRVKKLFTNNSLPSPKEISIKSIFKKCNRKCNGKLIKLKNVRIEIFHSDLQSRIDDNLGNKLYINNIDLPHIESGDIVDIIGIVNYDKKNYNLYIRKASDVIKIHPPIDIELFPEKMTSTFNRRTVISALLKSGEEFIDLTSVNLIVDGEKVQVKVENNYISYLPSQDLEMGEHYMKLLIKDSSSYSYQFKWRFRIVDKTTKYNFYLGIPHAHTSFSDGMKQPVDAYECSKKNGLDFLIVSDHSGSLNRSMEYPFEKVMYKGEKKSKWKILKFQADDINNKYDDFLAFFGFEMNTKIWGHMNVINSQSVIKKETRKKIEGFYEWLCDEDNIVLSINHPCRLKTIPSYIPEFDKYINLIEVGNGSPPRKYQRYEEEYYNILDLGWHLGAVNGQDNHSANWGKVDNLTVIIAENLKKVSIMEALKARRVYSTETKTLRLSVTGNGYWMGSIINLVIGDKLNLNILAEDNKVFIDKIQIISNKGVVIQEKGFKCSNRAEWNIVFIPKVENSWYVVKIIQSGGKCGISSPIFICF